MKIVYSFNKTGFEAEYWAREIAAASGDGVEFIPFNHGLRVDPALYKRAQKLDDLYFARHAALLRLYAEVEALLATTRAEALLVDNQPPYHPEFLRHLGVHKVLRTSDGPITAYDIDFAYLHAYDQVLYHTPAYSAELTMAEKLAYCGARRADFWPMAVFDVAFDRSKTEETIFSAGPGHRRRIRRRDARRQDGVPCACEKGPRAPLEASRYLFAQEECVLQPPVWVPGVGAPACIRRLCPFYQRAKIGINVHNRGDYSVGNSGSSTFPQTASCRSRTEANGSSSFLRSDRRSSDIGRWRISCSSFGTISRTTMSASESPKPGIFAP